MSKEYLRDWRKQLRRLQLCEKCKAPSKHKTRCDKCAEAATPGVKRQLTDDQWQAADWSKNDVQLGLLLGVKDGTVARHRRRLGKPAHPAGRPRKPSPGEHDVVVEAITQAALRGVE